MKFKIYHSIKIENLKFRFILGALLFVVLFALPKNTYAALSSCDASITPNNVGVNTTSDFSFSVTNTDTSGGRMVWIRITRPSANFTINSGSGSDATATGFDAGVGSPYNINLSVTTGGSSASSANWTVQASDDGSGTDAVTCGGSLGTSITGPAVNISDIVISDITDSEAKITWTTDVAADSQIDYGTTTAYDLNKSDSTQSTSHNLVLTGLLANTTYHYNIKSGSSESGDRTFATAKAGLNTVSTVTNTVTKVVTVTPTPPKSTPTPAKSSTKTPVRAASQASGQVLGASVKGGATSASPKTPYSSENSVIKIGLITTGINALLVALGVATWRYKNKLKLKKDKRR